MMSAETLAAADDPADSGRLGLQRYERHYRSLKDHHDPMIEFFLGWLRRNPVDTRGRGAVEGEVPRYAPAARRRRKGGVDR